MDTISLACESCLPWRYFTSLSRSQRRKRRSKKTTNLKMKSNTITGAMPSPVSDTHLISGEYLNYQHSDEFRYIDGRRYHNIKSSRYWLPNDEREQERMFRVHENTRDIWQSNHAAPIHDKLKSGGICILDVGVGSGAWTLEMANQYPKCHFTGVDFSSILSRESRPENVAFVEANILDGLPFALETFDYVFMRYMSCFSEAEWTAVVHEIVRVTKSGGFIEIMEEESGLHNDGPISRLLYSAVIADLQSRDIAVDIHDRMVLVLSSTKQFTRVSKQQVFAPLGKWAGKLGADMADIAANNFRSLKNRLSQILGVEPEEYDTMIESWPDEIDEYKPFAISNRWWGQKV